MEPEFEPLESLLPKKGDGPRNTFFPDGSKQNVRSVNRNLIETLAATFLIGALLFSGSRAVLKIVREAPSVKHEVPAIVVTSAPTAPKPVAPGPLVRIRKAIANRAAVELTDSFHAGMEAWGNARQWAPGWSHHPDGYVNTGQLALFEPTLAFTDYRLEFFGQIETKSMGWVVRAQDKQNYYAMKFKVIDPGLRPVIAMVHYPVIGGRKGRSVEVPLDVMVHNNTPYHVSVSVKGHNIVTSIEGQEVDSFSDETLSAGGVGFFSETGERARLYWMKVAKNEDFWGRVCAYMSGSSAAGARTIAALLPLIPQGALNYGNSTIASHNAN
jgi:hypothetical protein